jgi:hypothetical protein
LSDLFEIFVSCRNFFWKEEKLIGCVVEKKDTNINELLGGKNEIY